MNCGLYIYESHPRFLVESRKTRIDCPNVSKCRLRSELRHFVGFFPIL